MISVFRGIDLFGVPIELCFGGKKVHKTPWGGVWTTMIMITVISVFCILGLKIVFHQNPIITIIEKAENIYETSKRATIASINIGMGFVLYNKDYQVVKDWNQYIQAKGYVINQQGFSSINLQEIKFDKCSNVLQGVNADLFSKDALLDEMICVSNSEELTQYLTGELGSDNYTHLNVEISLKSEISDQDKLFFVSQAKNIGMFFTDYILDLQNFDRPLTIYKKNIIFQVKAGYQYLCVLVSQHSIINTDEGFFSSETNEDAYISFKEYRLSQVELSDQTIMQIKTEIDPRLAIYKRSYLKVFDLLGAMGGLIKALMIIGFALANPVAKLSLKTQLVNKIFKFEEEGNSFNEEGQEGDNLEENISQIPQEKSQNYKHLSLQQESELCQQTQVPEAKQKILNSTVGSRQRDTTDCSRQQLREPSLGSRQQAREHSLGSRVCIREATLGSKFFSKEGTCFNDTLNSTACLKTNFQKEFQDQSRFLNQPHKNLKIKNNKQKELDYETNSPILKKLEQADQKKIHDPNNFVSLTEADHQKQPTVLIAQTQELNKDQERKTKILDLSCINQKEQQNQSKLNEDIHLCKKDKLVQDFQKEKKENQSLKEININEKKMDQFLIIPEQRPSIQSLGDDTFTVNRINKQRLTRRGEENVKMVRTVLEKYATNQSPQIIDQLKSNFSKRSKKKETQDQWFKKLFKSNEPALSMKLWDYIKYFLGMKSQVKNKQIKYSMERINERLDIVFIMKKLIEVDKLKMVFFNKNQRQLFEYLPRPTVPLNPEFKNQITEKHKQNDDLNKLWAIQMFDNDQTYLSKAYDAMIAFRMISQKGRDVNEIDERLINMLDDSKKLIFQQEQPQFNAENPSQVYMEFIKNSNRSRLASQNFQLNNNNNNNISILDRINNASAQNKEKLHFVEEKYINVAQSESIDLSAIDLKNMNEEKDNQLPNLQIAMHYDSQRFNRRNTLHFTRHQTLNKGNTCQISKRNQSNSQGNIFNFENHFTCSNPGMDSNEKQMENGHHSPANLAGNTHQSLYETHSQMFESCKTGNQQNTKLKQEVEDGGDDQNNIPCENSQNFNQLIQETK